MPNHVFSRIRCIISLARQGGIKALLGDVIYQVYSTNVYLGFEKDLTEDDAAISCGIEYQVYPGAEDEMESIFQGIRNENKKTALELITRKRFYDLGFHNYYIAREKETRQPCYLVCIIFGDEANAKSHFFIQHFTELKPDEMLLEGSLTFDKFRGKNVSPSVTAHLAKLARSQGYRRMITYILKDNTAVARVCEKAGFRQFNTIIERRFLFSNKRSIIDETQHTRS